MSTVPAYVSDASKQAQRFIDLNDLNGPKMKKRRSDASFAFIAGYQAAMAQTVMTGEAFDADAVNHMHDVQMIVGIKGAEEIDRLAAKPIEGEEVESTTRRRASRKAA